MSDSVWPYGPQPARSLCPWDSPGENTGVGHHTLLQGIFPTWGLNLQLFCLLHRQTFFFFFFFFITSTIWEAQVHPKLQSTKWSHSVVSDSVIPWTVAHQAPPPMEFSRQEYWSVLSLPSPGDLPNPGIEHRSSALRVEALPSEPPGKQKYILDGVKPLVTPVWP